jgi:hypothetical protein
MEAIMQGSYWTGTEDFFERNGGKGPTCSYCGKEMFPEDDHGRFACFCDGYLESVGIKIPNLNQNTLPKEEK